VREVRGGDAPMAGDIKGKSPGHSATAEQQSDKPG